MAATEQSREQLGHSGVGVVECFLESRTRLAIDLADRILQRLQRLGQIGKLRIQIFLARRLLFVLVNRG